MTNGKLEQINFKQIYAYRERAVINTSFRWSHSDSNSSKYLKYSISNKQTNVHTHESVHTWITTFFYRWLLALAERKLTCNSEHIIILYSRHYFISILMKSWSCDLKFITQMKCVKTCVPMGQSADRLPCVRPII